jgi:hypothetical protein
VSGLEKMVKRVSPLYFVSCVSCTFSFLDTSLLIDPFPIILYAYIGPLYETMVFVHEFTAAAVA